MATQPRLTYEEARQFPQARGDRFDQVPDSCVLEGIGRCPDFVSLEAKSKAGKTRGVVCACGGVKGGRCAALPAYKVQECYRKTSPAPSS